MTLFPTQLKICFLSYFSFSHSSICIPLTANVSIYDEALYHWAKVSSECQNKIIQTETTCATKSSPKNTPGITGFTLTYVGKTSSCLKPLGLETLYAASSSGSLSNLFKLWQWTKKHDHILGHIGLYGNHRKQSV